MMVVVLLAVIEHDEVDELEGNDAVRQQRLLEIDEYESNQVLVEHLFIMLDEVDDDEILHFELAVLNKLRDVEGLDEVVLDEIVTVNVIDAQQHTIDEVEVVGLVCTIDEMGVNE